MARLLLVHHTPSPHLHTMVSAVREGAADPQIGGVEVEVRAALSATAADVLAADGIVVGGPANLGYLAGAVKHFFDTIYYPCLEATVGRPYGVFIHGNSDTDGAQLAIEKIVTGLRWKQAHAPVHVIDKPTKDDLEACWDLGATLAAGLMDV